MLQELLVEQGLGEVQTLLGIAAGGGVQEGIRLPAAALPGLMVLQIKCMSLAYGWCGGVTCDPSAHMHHVWPYCWGCSIKP